jgi:gliding motility-associated-like protein
VFITPPSPLPGVAPVTYCQSQPSSPLTATGQNLLWYGTAATGGTASPSAPSPSTATAGTTNYYVTQTSNGCPSARAAIAVTVKPKPVTPTATITNLIYCQYEVAAPLSATGTGTILYYTSQTGGTGVTTLIPTTNNPGTFYYYADQTVNGCPSDRIVYTVVVKAKPGPPIVVSPVNLCQYDQAPPLTAQGQNLKWYPSASGGTGVPTPPIPYTGYEDSIRYYVTQTINGCESDRAVIQVNVNYKPNATFVASKPYVCQLDTISFNYYGNARPNAEYNWFIPSPYGTIESGQGTQGPLVAHFDSAGIFNVRLIVNNRGCLSAPVFLPVEVRPLPVLHVKAKSDVCIGEVVDIILDSATTGVATFNWTFDGGEMVYGTQTGGPYGIRWQTPGDKYVTVTGTTRNCTSKELVDTITVHDYPTVEFINKPSGDICAGDSVRLQVRDLGPGYFYAWTPQQFFGSKSETSGGSIAWATPSPSLTKAALYVTVSDSFGCKTTDSLVLNAKPCCDVYFPNAFTPNNDGTNDRFMIISAGHPNLSSFRVINRWGRVIWETGDSRQGWDGTYAGEPQPTGTYFYYARYKCANGQEYEQKGEVTLVR